MRFHLVQKDARWNEADGGGVQRMNQGLLMIDSYRSGMAILMKGVFKATTSRACEEALNACGFFQKECSLNGIPAKAGKQVGMAFFKLFLDFPFLAGRIDGVTVGKTGRRSLAVCWMQTQDHEFAGGQVELNQKRYRDLRKLNMDYQRGDEFHPENTDYSAIITHELGHTLDGYLTGLALAGYEKDGRKLTVSKYLKKQTLKQMKLKTGDVKGELSGYAQRNPAEWFAECFAEYLESQTPREMCKECMYQLRILLRREYYQGIVDLLNGCGKG